MGIDVSTSMQGPSPSVSNSAVASRMRCKVWLSAGLCGPLRTRRVYRSTATSAGTRHRTSVTREPVVVSSCATRVVSRPGWIQMSTTATPSMAANWAPSTLSAANRRATPSSRPSLASKRLSLMASKARSGASSAAASARPSVVFPEPGTPVTTTARHAGTRALTSLSSLTHRVFCHSSHQTPTSSNESSETRHLGPSTGCRGTACRPYVEQRSCPSTSTSKFVSLAGFLRASTSSSMVPPNAGRVGCPSVEVNADSAGVRFGRTDCRCGLRQVSCPGRASSPPPWSVNLGVPCAQCRFARVFVALASS